MQALAGEDGYPAGIRSRRWGGKHPPVGRSPGNPRGKCQRSVKAIRSRRWGGKHHELDWNVNLPLYKRTDKFYFWTDNMIDHDAGSGKDYMGAIGWNDSHTTRSLSGLRENNSFWHKVTGDADKYNSTYDFRAVMSDND